jgi:hypothetical protein
VSLADVADGTVASAQSPLDAALGLDGSVAVPRAMNRLRP